MYNVQVTEELTEKLTPEKGQVGEDVRLAVLEKLAETLLTQGNYHLATKKFTQAGDKVLNLYQYVNGKLKCFFAIGERYEIIA